MPCPSPALRIPTDQVLAIQRDDLVRHLVARGWLRDMPRSSPRVAIFYHPAYEGHELLVPWDRDWADYAQRITDVLVTVAATEKRSVWELMNSLVGRCSTCGGLTNQPSLPVGQTCPADAHPQPTTAQRVVAAVERELNNHFRVTWRNLYDTDVERLRERLAEVVAEAMRKGGGA